MSESYIPPRPPRVAVVEDDQELRTLVADDLHAHGCVVEALPSAEALYRHMSVHEVDVVVLDIGLPGEDGYSVTSHLRQLSSVGIILLTARDDAGAMARGLRHGADVFLAKPVDFDVLATSVANLQRRLTGNPGPAAPSVVNQDSGAWRLIAGGWTLRGPGGHELPLLEAERALLQLLFAHIGQPVARELLIEALTDKPWDFDPHRLEVLLHRLRTRVKARIHLALPVRAVRGTGYLLAQ